MNSQRKRSAFPIAAGGICGALALLFLYGACAAPTGQIGFTAVAGLGPLAVVASFGIRSGVLCWGGVSLLALLILPNKVCAILFAALFGLYPMVKALLERIKWIWLSYAGKLVFFNAVLSVLLFTVGTVIMDYLPRMLEGNLWLVYGVGNAVFLLYDCGLTKVIRFYLARIDRVLRRRGRTV